MSADLVCCPVDETSNSDLTIVEWLQDHIYSINSIYLISVAQPRLTLYLYQFMNVNPAKRALIHQGIIYQDS